MNKDQELFLKKAQLKSLLTDPEIKFDDSRIINLSYEIMDLEKDRPKSKKSLIIFVLTLLVIGIICITTIVL